MPRRALLIGLKLTVSAALIAWLWSRFDIAAAMGSVLAMEPAPVAAAFAVLLLHGVASAWRWRTIVMLQGGDLPWSEALRLFFIAMFFNQTLSTTVGGDAARVWMLHGNGTTVGTAASGVVLERVAGLLALAPLILLGIGMLPDPFHPALFALLVLAVGFPAALIPAAGLTRSQTRGLAALGRFAETGRRVLFSRKGLVVFGQSVAIHLGAGFAVYLLAKAVGASPGVGICLALTPPVFLLATLPISFGGWGPREAALIWLFGFFGVAAELSLAISVALGVLVMAAGLPGAILWLSWTTRTRSTGPAKTAAPPPPGAEPPRAAAQRAEGLRSPE